MTFNVSDPSHNTTKQPHKTALATRLARARPGGYRRIHSLIRSPRNKAGLSGSLFWAPFAHQSPIGNTPKLRQKPPQTRDLPICFPAPFLQACCRCTAGAPRQIKPLQLCGQLYLQHKATTATTAHLAHHRAARNTTVSATVLRQARQWSTSPLESPPDPDDPDDPDIALLSAACSGAVLGPLWTNGGRACGSRCHCLSSGLVDLD